MDMGPIRTVDIIPVDLNVFMTLNEKILSGFAKKLGDNIMDVYFGTLVKDRSSLILKKLFNKEMNQWNDFIISEK
jgi:neutral trehalase